MNASKYSLFIDYLKASRSVLLIVVRVTAIRY